ncbi:MAG: class I SAM-dependent methyltransferase [Promethearchaeota archaeon]
MNNSNGTENGETYKKYSTDTNKQHHNLSNNSQNMESNSILNEFQKRLEFNKDVIERVVQELNMPLNAKILDIGTGWGIMAIYLAMKGYNVITGEPELDNWGNWRQYAEHFGVSDKIKFIPFHAEKLPFDNNCFDYVFMYATFHHSKSKKKALEEAFRVAKKEGFVIVIELNKKAVEEIRKRRGRHPDAIDPIKYLKAPKYEITIIKGENANAFIFSEPTQLII